MASRTEDQRPYIVLGVSGGIAAYKACELLRRFTESGHAVRVIPTNAALRFVGAATWESLSGERVTTSVYDDVAQVAHVRIGKQADLVVVAPATADLIARAAAGRADDLLTATLLTATCPVVMAPAMHTEMWQHLATQANVATLRRRGVLVLDPAVGRLTGSDTGPGRLPDPGEIFDIAVDVLRRGRTELRADLTGRRVVVSAGGTREPLDPVRFLGNRSSGRQGYALAKAAVARGADVTLVAANTDLADPAGVKVVRVGSTLELADAVVAAAAGADAVVMAAAPADFRPAEQITHKIKKRADGVVPEVTLVENPDILAGLVRTRSSSVADAGRQVLVGFAAETGDADGDVLDHGRQKLRRKGCDLLVVNDVTGGQVFGEDRNAAVILSADGSATAIPDGPKVVLAHAVWDRVAAVWDSHP
jgi:phosphopantothenoylcysteine decarboxylase / phosphopantothenate---cysteine ligase